MCGRHGRGPPAWWAAGGRPWGEWAGWGVQSEERAGNGAAWIDVMAETNCVFELPAGERPWVEWAECLDVLSDSRRHCRAVSRRPARAQAPEQLRGVTS